MLERAVLISGCVIGIGAGVLFYYTLERLRLPAPIFLIVDLFGPLAGAIFVGLVSALIVVGVLVLVIDWLVPNHRDSQSQ
jgi:hypothetical protein